MPGTRKLGRVTQHRMPMLYGMVTDLLANGEIKTTYTRAKEVSALADAMITLGKKGDLAAYREALALLTKEDVAKKLFSIIAPSYAKRVGGYTRIYKLGPRRGDAAEMALLRLVEADKAEAPAEEAKPKKRTSKKAAIADAVEVAAPKKTTRKKAAPKAEEAPAAEEAVAAPAADAE